MRRLTKDKEGNVIIIEELDAKGDILHYKTTDGTTEFKSAYDENGNMIYHEDITGIKEWSEYDNNGRLIHYKDSDGYEKWNEYDEYGNTIHNKWNEYDEYGNTIHNKYSVPGFNNELEISEVWREYDNNGRVIHFKNSTGWEEFYEYEED